MTGRLGLVLSIAVAQQCADGLCLFSFFICSLPLFGTRHLEGCFSFSFSPSLLLGQKLGLVSGMSGVLVSPGLGMGEGGTRPGFCRAVGCVRPSPPILCYRGTK